MTPTATMSRTGWRCAVRYVFRTQSFGALCLALVWASHATAAAQPAKAPALTDLRGAAFDLQALRGRVVLVNFWATWCAPCRREMPELNRLSGQLDPRDALIIGVAADEPAPVKAFVAKLGIHYPIATGNPDQIFGWTASLGNVTEGLPFSILMDQRGQIRWAHNGGGLTVITVKHRIDGLLANTQH
jgi:thiol-disulfide isomerase/thioredoxin